MKGKCIDICLTIKLWKTVADDNQSNKCPIFDLIPDLTIQFKVRFKAFYPCGCSSLQAHNNDYLLSYFVNIFVCLEICFLFVCLFQSSNTVFLNQLSISYFYVCCIFDVSKVITAQYLFAENSFSLVLFTKELCVDKNAIVESDWRFTIVTLLS